MKQPAIISLAVNLALAGFLLWPRSTTTEKSPDVGNASVQPSVKIVTNIVTTIQNVEAGEPRFDWTLIESEDYRTYMGNLRRLEMPEWLIRELVLQDLMRHYAVLAVQLPEDQPTYWLTHQQARELGRRREKAGWALKEEEYAVMRQLTGTYRHKDAEDATSDGDFAVIFGTLTGDQAKNIISELSFVHDRAKYLEKYQGGLLSRADQQSLITAYNEAKANLSSRISPGLIEEFFLRLQVVLGSLTDDYSMPGLQLTGSQLRDLIRIRAGIIDPLRWELTEEDKPEGPERAKLVREVQEAVAVQLGEEVGRQYMRSQTPAFRSMYELTQRHQLPVETAVAVYDIRQATIDEVRSLVSSPEIDENSKWQMRQLIQLETEKAVQDTLGQAAWEDYRQADGRWMDRVGGQPQSTDTGGGQ